MKPDPKLRRSVERLLAGDGRPHDMTTLFSYIRENNFSRETVKEVGDALAHHGDRDRGLTTTRVRRLAKVAWGLGPFVIQLQGAPPAHRQVSIDEFREALKANFELKPSEYAALAGLNEQQARSALKRDLPLLAGFREPGRLIYRTPIRPAGIRLLTALATQLPLGSAFTADHLLEDVSYVLQRNGALSAEEVPALEPLRDAFAACALWAFAGSTFITEDGRRLPVDMDFNAERSGAHVMHPIRGSPGSFWGLTLFLVDGPPERLFHPGDLKLPAPTNVNRLDLTDDLRLRPY